MTYTPELLRDIERTLAYTNASSIIDSVTSPAPVDDYKDFIWHDLSDAEFDVSNEAAYLDSRGLLMHHPSNPQYVRILDECHPLTPFEQAVSA